MFRYVLIVPDDMLDSYSLTDDAFRESLEEFMAEDATGALVLPPGVSLHLEEDEDVDGPPVAEFLPRSEWDRRQAAEVEADRRRLEEAPRRAELDFRRRELERWEDRCRCVAAPVVIDRPVGAPTLLGPALWMIAGGLLVSVAPTLARLACEYLALWLNP